MVILSVFVHFTKLSGRNCGGRTSVARRLWRGSVLIGRHCSHNSITDGRAGGTIWLVHVVARFTLIRGGGPPLSWLHRPPHTVGFQKSLSDAINGQEILRSLQLTTMASAQQVSAGNMCDDMDNNTCRDKCGGPAPRRAQSV